MNSQSRILIVDDEADLRFMLTYQFEKAGFQVFVARNGQEALTQLDAVQPDLVLLDVMMNDMSGYEVCRRIRNDANWNLLPVIMLTSKNTEQDEVEGLDYGADDYLKKPVSMRLLVSRVQALLRRTKSMTHDGVLSFENLTVDPNQYTVQLSRPDGKLDTLHFPRREFELLAFLMERRGQVFSRKELLDQVWGNDVHVVDRTIDVHVRKIRQKLGGAFIETVKGVGYRFRTGAKK